MSNARDEIPAGRLRRYRKYLAKGLLPHKLLTMLGRAGILVQPYHFYREETAGRPPHLPGVDPSDFEFGEAGPGDVAGIAALDRDHDASDQIRRDFENGRRAFVLRKNGEIVAVTWCDTAEIHFRPCRRALAEDEAYLYGMETAYRHRGHDLAPYLRWKSNEFLTASGRRSLFSYSDYFNHSAVRFKEKLGAKILFTGLYLGIRRVGGKNWVLRRFDTGPTGIPSERSRR